MKTSVFGFRLFAFVLVTLLATLLTANTAFADITFSLRASHRSQPSIGVSGSNGSGFSVSASGVIQAVTFGKFAQADGKIQNVVAVTFNQSKNLAGDVESDTVYFTGEDAPIGLALSGAIGKKIEVNSQRKEFTISEK